MVSAHAVELEEGWFDMKFKKILSAVSPIASVINKSGPVHSALKRISGTEGTATLGGLAGMAARRAKKDPKTALEEGKERIAAGPQVTQMKKGGIVKKGYHKMPDGRMMKDSAHKKMAKKSTASKRADGICKKGKTKGRMC